MKLKSLSLLIIFGIIIMFASALYSQQEKEIKIMKKKGDKEFQWTGEDEREIMKHIEVSKPKNMMEKLNLTEDQKKKMEKMHFDMQKKQIDGKAKVKTAEIELKELFNADKPDKSAIEKKIKEISDLKGKMRTNHVDHWFDVNSILTPEQQKTWKEKLDKPMRHKRLKMMNDGDMHDFFMKDFDRPMRKMHMKMECDN